MSGIQDKAGVSYRPGPPKGQEPIVEGTGLTRRQLALKIGMEIVDRREKPTIRAVNKAEPRLTLGWLNANSKVPQPCRARWTGERPTEPEDENILSLDRARAERAIAELREEKERHDATREKLREANVIISRLLKGFADDMPVEDRSGG